MPETLIPLSFETVDEHWNVYLLSDETRLKQKFVLTAIARTDVYDALGRPVYKPFFVNLFVPVSPEELRGGPSSFIPSPRTVEDAEVEAVHIEKG